MTNRDSLDQWFARAEDVLTDWRGGRDTARWRPPEVNFDCPAFPSLGVTRVGAIAAAHGLDGYAAAGYREWVAREVAKRVQMEMSLCIAKFRVAMEAASRQIASQMEQLAEQCARSGNEIGKLVIGFDGSRGNDSTVLVAQLDRQRPRDQWTIER